MASYGIISLGKKLTHNCLSRLRSINEYLVFDWGGKGLRLRQSPSATEVRVELRMPTPQLASQSAGAPGQAPGDCLAWPIAPAQCTGTQPPGRGALPFNDSSLSICHFRCQETFQLSNRPHLLILRAHGLSRFMRSDQLAANSSKREILSYHVVYTQGVKFLSHYQISQNFTCFRMLFT